MRQVPRPQREFEDVDTESVALTMAPSLAPTTATRVTALAADDGDDSLSTIKKGASASQRMRSLQKALKKKSKEVKLHKERFEKMREDFTYNLGLLGERDEELAQYEASFAKLKQLLEGRETELGDARVKIEELTERLNSAVSDGAATRTMLEDQIATLQDQAERDRSRYEGMLSDVRSRLDDVKRQLEAQAREGIEALEAQRREMTLAFEQAQNTREQTHKTAMAALRSELAAEQGRLRQSQQDLVRMTDNRDFLQRQNESLEARVRELEAQLALAQQRAQDAEDERQRTQRRLEEQARQAASQSNADKRLLEERLARAEERIRSLEAQLRKQKDDYEAQLERMRRDHADELRRLRDSASDAELQLNSRVGTLESDLRQSQQDCKRAQQDLEAAQQRIADMERQHTQQQSLMNSEFNGQLEELKRQLAAARDEIERLEALVRSLRDTNASRLQELEQVQLAQRQAEARAEEERRRAEEQTARAEAEAKDALQQLEALRKSTAALRDEAQSAIGGRDEALSALADLERRYVLVKTDLINTQKRYHELHQMFGSQHQQHAAQQLKLEELIHKQVAQIEILRQQVVAQTNTQLRREQDEALRVEVEEAEERVKEAEHGSGFKPQFAGDMGPASPVPSLPQSLAASRDASPQPSPKASPVLARLKADRDEYRAQVEQLRTQNASILSVIAKMREEMERMHASEEQHKLDMQRAEERARAAQAHRPAHDPEAEHLRQRIADLERENRWLSERARSALAPDSDSHQLQSQLETSNSHIKRLLSERERLMQLSNRLKSELHSAQPAREEPPAAEPLHPSWSTVLEYGHKQERPSTADKSATPWDGSSPLHVRGRRRPASAARRPRPARASERTTASQRAVQRQLGRVQKQQEWIERQRRQQSKKRPS